MTLLTSGKYNVNNHAHILKGKGSISTEWIHAFYLHKDITFYLTRQGAGRFKLNKEALLGLPIAFPRQKEEQDNILKILDEMKGTLDKNIFSLQKLQSLKTALMQDLLTGKVSVDALMEQC